LSLALTDRATVINSGVPDNARSLFSIANLDGIAKRPIGVGSANTIPVEVFSFNGQSILGSILWQGILGTNVNTLGISRTYNDIQPNITIGPEDCLIFGNTISPATTPGSVQINLRGFYQEQPA